MKSFLRPAAALLIGAASFANIYGQSFENVAGTFTWSVGNESEPAVSETVAAALQSSNVTVGTDLDLTSTSATYKLTADGTGEEITAGPMCTYQPYTSNAGCVPTDMIEYTITLKKGLTITPTSISFDAVKEGTDNAYFSWSYTIDGVEGEIVAYDNPKEQIRRNNNANPEAPLTHNETISAEAGRVMTVRFYISNVANNKKMSIGNVKINGTVNGTAEARAFKNFKIDFRNEAGYVVTEPADGVLPEGVTVEGTFHDSQHGYNTTQITVPCDGPVKFTFGSCQYGGTTATIKGEDGEVMATVDCNAGCDSNTSYDHFVVWYYNSEEPQTLSITTASYVPFFYAEACELLPMVDVSYYDTDGKTLIGQETVQGGSKLVYTYGEVDVTVADGQKFRGWFNSTQSTAVKVAEGTMIQDDLKLYAKATDVEVPTSTSRYIYDLTKQSFYVEDHEAIEIDGKYYNNHGWLIDKGGSVRVLVAGKAYVSVGNCLYSAESEATITGEDGNVYGSFQVKGESDGAEATIQYDGPAQWLSITFPSGAYCHSVKVSNVVEFVAFDEETGYYSISAGDVSSFLIALTDANSRGNVKIFLPNGLYDLGETVLTPISGKNISIIGESMEGTIIRNAPAKEQEGIGTTATLLNTSDGLYLQDLTIQNALDYYATGAAGRAVCLQDKGKNTIAKNVRMLSYQDTYYSNAASRFYWEDSEIHGTVDYLCGDGDVVYNRVKFVNESRAKDQQSGSDVIAAPYTSANMQWGYVFLDCEISSECKDFTFARSWGGESKAQFIRTKVTDNSLNASRWTAAGMNVAAYKFKEYQTMDADGNVTTPESNVVNFTHNTGNREYETVLTDEEAAQYTIENIYGEWAPDQTAAQAVITCDEDLLNPEGVYLVTAPAEVEEAQGFYEIITAAEFEEGKQMMKNGDSLILRAQNSRGGFGPAYTYTHMVITSIEQIEAAAPKLQVSYNLFGQPVKTGTKGISVINGQKVIK